MKNISYLLIIFFTLICGCSNEPPKCSDPKTIEIVNQILQENSEKYIDTLLTKSPPPIKILKEDVLKKNHFIENIRAVAFDEKIKKFNCVATLSIPAIDDSNKTLNSEYIGKINFVYIFSMNEKPNWNDLFKIDLNYESQLNDKNEHIVVINYLTDKELYKYSLRVYVNEISKYTISTEVVKETNSNLENKQEDAPVSKKEEDLPKAYLEEQSNEKTLLIDNQSSTVMYKDLGSFVESSLTLDEQTGLNNIDGAKVVEVLSQNGILETKPVSSYDYHNYYLAKRIITVLGANLLAFNHQYIQKNLGCCPNEGNAVLLEFKNSLAEIEDFAKLNKCDLKIGSEMWLPDEVIKSLNINESNNYSLAKLSCQSDYR